MKNIYHVLLLLFAISFTGYAQNSPVESMESGGDLHMGRNDANNPCISKQQYEAILSKSI